MAEDFLKEIDAWDDRAKLHLKESLFNATSGATSARALLTNGDESYISEELLEITRELIQLGKRPDTSSLTSIGQIMARLYRTKYGEAPPKHQKEVNGEVRHVNMYFAKDKAMMREPIQTYCQQKQKEDAVEAAKAVKAAQGRLFVFGFSKA